MPCEAEMPCTTISSLALDSGDMARAPAGRKGPGRRSITPPPGGPVNAIYRIQIPAGRPAPASGDPRLQDEGGRAPRLPDRRLHGPRVHALVKERKARASASAHPPRDPEAAREERQEGGERRKLGECGA